MINRLTVYRDESDSPDASDTEPKSADRIRFGGHRNNEVGVADVQSHSKAVCITHSRVIIVGDQIRCWR